MDFRRRPWVARRSVDYHEATPMRFVVCLLILAPLSAQTPDQIEFFEKKIRPVLVEQCYACHSAETMAQAELLLDSAEALHKGGSRGPALNVGDLGASLLLRAISYADIELKMPPTGKLSDQQIADFRVWVEMGAPDPRKQVAVAAPPEPGIDLEAGRKFWAFQPIDQPTVPSTSRPNWVSTPIDAFLLARLEQEGLEPAAALDKRGLIRRATFDLIGLPPSPSEIAGFLADSSPDAYPKLVDRLLDSPHYGERWGRHWLDLVRYAETNGHEFDNDKLDIWRYRDYVIDAFNKDLPYDRFVQEQIAGDLLPPRISAAGDHFVTPAATGMYWLWEVLNSPTDSIQARADQVDNQLDVIGKAFFGLTIACARCHDHKFDPIPTADYYSMAGILHSTQMREQCVDTPQTAALIQARSSIIRDVNKDMASELRLAERDNLASLAAELVDGVERISDEDAAGWAKRLQEVSDQPDHPLHPFLLAEEEGLDEARAWVSEWADKANPAEAIWEERGDTVREDFEDGYEGWLADGNAFGSGPVRAVPPNQEISGYTGSAIANSFGTGSNAFVGMLTTSKFKMPARWVHVRMASNQQPAPRGAREKAKLRFTIVADDHKSGHAMPAGDGLLKWYTISMEKEKGRTCYLEIVDRDREGYIAVDKIVFSNSQEPPPIAHPISDRVRKLFAEGGPTSTTSLAQAYQGLALEIANKRDQTADEMAFLAAVQLWPSRQAGGATLTGPSRHNFDDLIDFRTNFESAIPASSFAMSSMDVDPGNIRIHQRGSHKNLGEEVPRRFLQVVAGADQEPFTAGSGRLDLARWAVSDENPLTARVMVNRVWKHHFGQGIVASTDNFGENGERPTHPALLDFLASDLIKNNWSIKQLHRSIMLSSAYQMDSRISGEAKKLDPANKLLSHMPVRRLEGEAIRDSVLAIAGTLNPTVGGPSIAPHISDYQDGRGKPKTGTLDGEGRRSVYIQARRNFLTPLLLAFDYPLPISTIGRRGVSAVPSQALILLNNEFLHDQAGKWARAELERYDDDAQRISDMFERAFGRKPSRDEVAAASDFLDEQSSRLTAAESDEAQPWTDLAHTLMNSAEFIFVR